MSEPASSERPPVADGPGSSRSVLSPPALLVEQRQRWQRGERVPVEAFLEKAPALGADADGLLDLIYNEFLLREEAGERPQPAEYLGRFPALAAPLQALFAVDHALVPGGPDPATATPVSAGSSALTPPA